MPEHLEQSSVEESKSYNKVQALDKTDGDGENNDMQVKLNNDLSKGDSKHIQLFEGGE